MRPIGFSTGALAKGDFRQALLFLRAHEVDAVELSALRDHELKGLVSAFDQLELSQYRYVSVHAPSRFGSMAEGEIAELLTPCIERGWPVIVHPDAMRDEGCWKQFGNLLCIENMDMRKPTGRTAAELLPWMERLPEASFCLDLGHGRQMDTTMLLVRDLLRSFGPRLMQLHVSELSYDGAHHALSLVTILGIQDVAHLLPAHVPAIIESVISMAQIDDELARVRRAMASPQSARSLADNAVAVHG